jgi:ferritin-like metal-binding protein YciE
MKSTGSGGAKSTSASKKTNTKSTPRSSKSNGSSSSQRSSLSKIFEDSLKDIYWAEKYLVKSLPKMSKAAYDENLSAAFDNHLQETQVQVERLEQVFDHLGKKAQAKKCPAMEGLVEEGKEAIDEYEEGYARDAALIIAAQKIEHYEIAAYGSLKAHAKMMGEDEVVSLLEQTEQEEGNTDKKLTELSKTVNEQAYSETEEEEE